ncbi:hypothetical protein GIB67_013747 [Kingdonia uniflora]|uniref:SMAX1-like nucleotide binding domain-containing protein n=1 Tax=Kingdonia uniflora TaxID=39325 RepID=A0A7J7NQ23_9MAGN|nr:hypothetical protein GIB67_013747 [Kingdonia uniflora]
MMNKRRGCTVIVGDCLDTTEAVLKGVKERVDKGDIPEDLSDLNFISLPLFSISILKREDVEHKMGELRSLVKNCAGSTRGVVLYLGDLKWVADFKASSCELDRNFYCPVKHTIMELGSLISGIGDSVRLWLMGIATFQTYQRCRIGQPSLETVWGLHPITIPAGSLGLTFNPESDSEIRAREGSCWQLHESGIEKDLNCRVNSSVKLQTGARSLVIPTTDNSTTTSPTSSLPSWLQQYKEESKRLINNDKDSVQVKELCNKWDSICNVVHKHHHETLTFDPISPSSSTSASSYDKHNRNLHKTRQFWIDDEPNLRMSFTDHRRPKFSYLFNSCPNSTVNSPPSSEDMDIEYFQRFKEVNGENLKTICNALEEKVPCQRDIIPDIASTILQCRSGMIRRKENIKHAKEKEDTWFLFEGVDIDGKEKIARELAKLVFGSQKNFVSIGLSSFSSTRMDSMEDIGTKRGRDESGCSCVKRLAEEIGIDPHRVFFVEDIDQVDYCSQLGIKRAMERGILVNSNGDEVFLSDAIVILSCESFKCRSRNSSPSVKENSDETEEKKVDRCEEESIPGISLDLNLSIEEKADDNMSIDDIGLLETFDGRVIFKLQAF